MQLVVDGDGNQQNFPVPPPLLAPVEINANSGFPLTLVAATAGMIIRVYRMFLTIDAATVLTFQDGATNLVPEFKPQAGEQITLDPQLFPWFQTTIGDALKLNSSNAVQITGAVWVNLNPT
jgi:hypothetical protein